MSLPWGLNSLALPQEYLTCDEDFKPATVGSKDWSIVLFLLMIRANQWPFNLDIVMIFASGLHVCRVSGILQFFNVKYTDVIPIIVEVGD